jgi:hypothetical protein
MAVKLSGLSAGRALPVRFLVLVSVSGRENPRAIARPEGLSHLKKHRDLNRNRIRYLPDCSKI